MRRNSTSQEHAPGRGVCQAETRPIGRSCHTGSIAAAPTTGADELLTDSPVIEPVGVPAAEIPGQE
jgi:hypothetical protein